MYGAKKKSYNHQKCNLLRSFRSRRLEHMGLSILTTRLISRPEYSQIRNHSEGTNHPLSHDNFSIACLAREAFSLTILESMLVAKYKPDLNVQNTLSFVVYCVIYRLHILIICLLRFSCTVCNTFRTFTLYIFRYFITEDEHSEARNL